jgi:hypothetical protein
MATQITINSTTGTLPLNVWLCDSCNVGATCVYLDTINSLPITLTIPATYESYVSYGIKFVDSLGCETCELQSTSIQFQNGDTFEFMDGIPYEF